MSIITKERIDEIKIQYADLINFSPYLIYIHDLKGNFLLANDITVRSLRYKRDLLLKLNIFKIVEKRSHSLVKKMIKDNINVNIIDFLVKAPVEFELKTRNNRKLNLEAFSIPIKKNDKTEAILVVAKDIYKRKKTEYKLKESEKKYQSLYEKSPFGILIIDYDYRIIDVNNAAVLLLGKKKEELINNIFTELSIIPESIKYLFSSLINSKKLDSVSLEYQVFKETNDILWVKGTFSKIKLENKNNLQIIMEDITEQKKHEEWRNNFIIRASHEIKTPLIGICGGSEKILETYKKMLNSLREIQDNVLNFIKDIVKQEDYTKIKEELEYIYSDSNIFDNLKDLDDYIKMYDIGARRMKNLTEELLNYSKIESGKFELNKKPTDLSKLINESIKLYNYLIKERKIRLIENIPNQLILNADETKIRLVFDNLLNNAIKFTPIGGKIFITVENDAKKVQISIRDNGIGLNDDEKIKIFEKFGKIKKESTDDLSEGFGIGLYISKNAVELHGGTISAESLGKNKGSNFIVELPL